MNEIECLEKKIEEAEVAFKYLLKLRETDNIQLQKNVLHNIKHTIEPYLIKLKASKLSSNQKKYIELIETNLNELVSSFHRTLSIEFIKLSPMELQIADLIRLGKTSKEIAELMRLSEKTIATHRNNVRKKLGINNKKVPLRTYLLTLEADQHNEINFSCD